MEEIIITVIMTRIFVAPSSSLLLQTEKRYRYYPSQSYLGLASNRNNTSDGTSAITITISKAITLVPQTTKTEAPTTTIIINRN